MIFFFSPAYKGHLVKAENILSSTYRQCAKLVLILQFILTT